MLKRLFIVLLIAAAVSIAFIGGWYAKPEKEGHWINHYNTREAEIVDDMETDSSFYMILHCNNGYKLQQFVKNKKQYPDFIKGINFAGLRTGDRIYEYQMEIYRDSAYIFYKGSWIDTTFYKFLKQIKIASTDSLYQTQLK